MKRTLLLVLAALVAAPAGAQSAAPALDVATDLPQGRQCGAVELDPIAGQAAAEAISRWLQAHPDVTDGATAVSIPVAFHVVHRTNGVGNIPDSRLDAQITVLNNAYAGSGFSFYRASVDRTASNSWFGATYGSSAERSMKRALARNVSTTLNFYTNSPGQGLLGWATFPWDYAQSDYRHGVVVHYNSLPGGTLAPYHLGDTGTHEVGHYLGLYHTFQGGCSATAGDYVSDTAAEASPAYGCPSGRDSCPTLSGLDPITNFMDYTDDACMNQFSGGQQSRMAAAVAQYRPSLGTLTGPGGIAVASLRAGGPEGTALRVAPNPLADVATVQFTLPEAAAVTVRVYDALGRVVATLVDDAREAGTYEAYLDAAALAPGAYIARMTAGGAVSTVRLTVAR